MLKRLVLVIGVASLGALTVLADTLPSDPQNPSSPQSPTNPQDPQMGVDSGSFSSAFTKNVTLSANAGGGGAFGFYNPGPGFITDLGFNTTIQAGLTQAQIASNYSCNQPSAFFLDCSVTYTASNGLLAFRFFGVNPDDNDSTEDEVGEQEGIPPLLPGCGANPDGEGCTDVGHFIITLNNGFTPDPNGTGGWTPNQDFKVSEINGVAAVPEPASVLLLLGAVGGIALIRRRRVF